MKNTKTLIIRGNMSNKGNKGNRIVFDFELMKWQGITVEQVKFWESCYPEVDVIDTLTKRIPAWLDANPTKACKYKNWKRFINGWLSRQQDRYSQFRQGGKP